MNILIATIVLIVAIVASVKSYSIWEGIMIDFFAPAVTVFVLISLSVIGYLSYLILFTF